MPTQLQLQDFYSTVITEPSGIPATGDFDFTVAVAPQYNNGFIVVSANNSTLRDVFYFHNRVGNRLYVRKENRLTGNKAHTVNESVQINDTANIFNYFSDMISQAFFVEKTWGLNVRVNGWYVTYNGNVVAVGDQNLTLADNTTNYIKYDYPTNTISFNGTNSGNVKAVVTTLSWVITSIVYRNPKESYIDFTVAITWALPSQAWNAGKALVTDGTNVSWWVPSGLRTNMFTTQSITATNGSPNITVFNTDWWFPGMLITWTGIPDGTSVVSFVPNTSAVLSANFTGTTWVVESTPRRLHLADFTTSWQELLRPIWVATSISSDDALTKRKSNGSYDLVFWNDFQTQLNWIFSNDLSCVAWENISQNDALIREFCIVHPLLTTAQPKWSDQNMGDTSARTRRSLARVIWNGNSGNTIRVYVRKSGAPIDNCIIRIETDDGTGRPSGTLVHANATAQIAWSTITTSYVDTTFTFAGSFTMTEGVPYHIVAQRSGWVDGSLFYQFGHFSITTRGFTTNTFNGTVWGTPATNVRAFFVLPMAHTTIVTKANASQSDSISFIGFAKNTIAIWGRVNVAEEGITRLFTWLARDTTYFLSNTPGSISTTPWTVWVAVWRSDSTTTNLDIIPFRFWYIANQNFFTETSVSLFNGYTFYRHFIADRYMWIRYNQTAFTYREFYINNVAQAYNTPVLVKPGDNVYMSHWSIAGWYPGTLTFEVSPINNYWPTF